MRIILIVLLLTIPAYSQSSLDAQIKTFRNHNRFSVNYDKFKDQTRVSVGPFHIGGLKASMMSGFKLKMSAHFFTPNPSHIYLALESTSQKWTFLRNSNLYILADGQRYSLGAGQQSDYEIRRRSVSELMVYKIPLETFTSIANSKSAELKIGQKELDLKDEHLEAFRDLASLVK